MEIQEYSPQQFNELKKAWKELESGDDMTVFQHYDWYKYVNALYEKEHAKKLFREWVYLLVVDNEQPIMIAPIQIIKAGAQYKNVGLARGAYFIGRQGYSDYLNFIYRDFSENAARSIFNYLKSERKLNRVCFEQLLENTDLYHFLVKEFNYTQSECYCASLELPETFEEYRKLLSKNTRQNIRTAINRQKRNELALTHEIVYQLDPDMSDVLMKIREQRLAEKRKNSSTNASIKGRIYGKFRGLVVKLFSAEQDVINESCNPWCFLVKDGDRIVSYFWGMRNDYRDEYYVILAGVDKDYTWYSPSLSHLYLFIQEQYESGDKKVKVLDFTRGGERYKEDMGASKKSAWAITFKI